MSQWSESTSSAREQLSALMDGEASPLEAQQAVAAWRDEAASRSAWHAYQLIGDVLRSDELASRPVRDEQFLQRLRGRLSQEPVVLAPDVVVPAREAASMQASARRHKRWAAPMAVAAGFFAVVGAVVVTQMGPVSTADSPVMAGASVGMPGAAGLQAVSASGSSRMVDVGEPQAVTLDGQLIRDARLDQYLAAHKKFGGSSAPGGPSGFLRNAAVEASSR